MMDHGTLHLFGMNKFHNSVPEKDVKVLEKRERQARSKNSMILALFKENPYAKFTPYDVYLRFGQQIDQSTIRRAITDLTTDGELFVTDEQRPGRYPNHLNNCWQYNLKKQR